MNLYTEDSDGVQEFHSTLSTVSMKEIRQLSAPASFGGEWDGTKHEEASFMSNGSHAIKAKGTMFLGSVDVDTHQTLTGQLAQGGIFPIAPSALGGRLSALAKLYQMHVGRRFVWHYVPTVPTDTPGSIAIYYHGDDALDLAPLGVAGLRMAATHSSFRSTAVWSPVEAPIDPDDTLKKFYDESSSEFRFSIQGALYVMLASAFAPANQMTLGNIFLEYEVDFMDPFLDDVVENTTGWATNLTAGTSAVVAGEPVAAILSGTDALALSTLNLPTGLTASDMADYVFVMTVDNSTYDGNFKAAPSAVGPDYSSIGSGMYVRAFWHSSGTVYAMFFANMAAASNFVFDANIPINTQVAVTDQLVYGAAGVKTGVLVLVGHGWGITNS